MDVLHGEVVHQGQQSILLEAKVCQIAQRGTVRQALSCSGLVT